MDWIAWIKITNNTGGLIRSINVLGETSISKPRHYTTLIEKGFSASVLDLDLDFVQNDVHLPPPPFLLNFSRQLVDPDKVDKVRIHYQRSIVAEIEDIRIAF